MTLVTYPETSYAYMEAFGNICSDTSLLLRHRRSGYERGDIGPVMSREFTVCYIFRAEAVRKRLLVGMLVDDAYNLLQTVDNSGRL